MKNAVQSSRRLRVSGHPRALLLFSLVVAWLGLGCVEREILPANPKLLTERFGELEIKKNERDFVMHHLEIGGIAHCTEGSSPEQTTELYLKSTELNSDEPLNVSRLTVRLTYTSGLFRDVQVNAEEKQASYVELTERISAKFNGETKLCSCVRANGFARIIGRTVVVTTRICPEQLKPKEKPVIRVRPDAEKPRVPRESL